MRSSRFLALSILICGAPIFAQGTSQPDRNVATTPKHSITSITVCKPITGSGSSGSCSPGSVDTAERVLAPDGGFINDYAGLGTLADEHATIFPPGSLPGRSTSDYLFLVASKSALDTKASGLTFLTGGAGPDSSGQWTFDFAPDFGLYEPNNPPGTQNGQVFLAAMAHDNCPNVAGGQFQDQTFDLNYADPGTVFIDPTSWRSPRSANMLMIYEGTSRCVGLSGGTSSSNFYSTIGVATSVDFGHTWPTYRRNWVELPDLNPTNGPEAPLGAFGNDVCFGNDCTQTPPHFYGRYAVLSPPVTLETAATAFASTPGGLPMNMGNTEPAAFVDDVSRGHDRYVYTVAGYLPGPAGLGAQFSNPPLPNGVVTDLVVSRARLNGGVAPLEFTNWYAGSFDVTRVIPPGETCNWWEPCRTISNIGSGNFGGGLQTPVLPFVDGPDAHKSCQDATVQARVMGSISYVEDTQQYLLLFVCTSHVNPETNETGDGAAWFYSTTAASGEGLSDQSQWSTPQMILGSWNMFPSAKDAGCARANKGWYPTIMSMGTKPSHLSTTGYIFYMEGCTDGSTTGGRKYSSRQSTITTN
jgi:hypothetical protein